MTTLQRLDETYERLVTVGALNLRYDTLLIDALARAVIPEEKVRAA